MSTAGVCSVCSTPLHFEECWKCSGRGRLRAWLVFWRKCPLCSGAGERALCPDRREHLFASAALRAGSGAGDDHAVKREAITSFARDRVRSGANVRVRHPRREVRKSEEETTLA
jgi:hypothetical protein